MSLEPEPHELRPQYRQSAGRVRSSIVLAFAIAVLLVVMWFIRGALLIIYVSSVFAVVLKPGVDWLHRRSFLGWHPGRGTALLLIVVLLCSFAGVLIAIAVPSIVSSVGEFSNSMTAQIGSLERRLHSVPLLRNVKFSELPSRVSGGLAKVVPAAGSAMASILTGLLLTAYLILDGAGLLKRTLLVLPEGPRARLDVALHRAGRRMLHWLAGQAMLMLILGSASTVTFGLMGLPYFYLLGVFAGMANIVPLLGPLATVVVASGVAATQSGWDVLGVLIFYLVYQQVENAFLTPKIMKSQVQLPSAIVIIALLIGSELAGIAGALVAVPTAVLVAELADEYLIHDPSLAER